MIIQRSFRPSTWRHMTRVQAPLSPTRSYAHHHKHHAPPPFPVIEKCSESCTCAPTPSFPPGKEIDHSKPLNGTMAGYAEQLLVCTGQDDWVSRVEEENGGENLVADVKELIGRGGPYADPWHNVPLTNASFPPTVPTGQVARGLRDTQTTSAYVLPSFKYVPVISRDAVEALVKGFLLPERLNHAHKGLSQLHKDQLTRHEGFQGEFPGVRDVEDVLVLICGHGGRDVRCGVLGPLLQEEFEKNIPAAAGLELLQGAVSLEAGEKSKDLGVRVGLCSHIGGHKFAGNVIIYVPPRAKLPSGEQHPLRGMGIWYGRVEPKHVEGIVRETLVGGKVIQEFFRGGVQKDKGILRL